MPDGQGTGAEGPSSGGPPRKRQRLHEATLPHERSAEADEPNLEGGQPALGAFLKAVDPALGDKVEVFEGRWVKTLDDLMGWRAYNIPNRCVIVTMLEAADIPPMLTVKLLQKIDDAARHV